MGPFGSSQLRLDQRLKSGWIQVIFSLIGSGQVCVSVSLILTGSPKTPYQLWLRGASQSLQEKISFFLCEMKNVFRSTPLKKNSYPSGQGLFATGLFGVWSKILAPCRPLIQSSQKAIYQVSKLFEDFALHLHTLVLSLPSHPCKYIFPFNQTFGFHGGRKISRRPY